MLQMIREACLLLFLLMMTTAAFGQKVIKGVVRDDKTGKSLPSANIIIKNSYHGTVTNRDGRYSLSIPDSLLPATVKVSYIGYKSAVRTIKAGSASQQSFRLKPSIKKMKQIVVTNENPAVRIMKLVIEHKQQWWGRLRTYKAEAYTRQNLMRDTTMVMITESASKEYWSRQKGPREVLKWRHQTANISAGENFAGVRYLPNFYDDNIQIAGFRLVGVTNPLAFSYYKFKLLGRLSRDGQTVYRIKVIPQKNLQPLFKGTVYVLDKKYALLKVNLKPNKVVRFPPPVRDFNLSYMQQFSNFGGDFWLPVDVRINGTIKISMVGLHFPKLKFRQLSKISNYQVNIPLPDSLYASKNVVSVDTTSLSRDSIASVMTVKPVPLSGREQHAYASLDSSQTLVKMLQPSGFLARFINLSNNSGSTNKTHHDTTKSGLGRVNIPGNFSPRGRYNRVDGLFAGLKYSVDPWKGLKISAEGGYSTANAKWSYGGGLHYRWSDGRLSPQIGIRYQVHTTPQYSSQIITPTLASISNILGYPNYFDYFREKALMFSGALTDQRTHLGLRVSFKSANQHSLQTRTAYDILGQHRKPRINPAINAGHLNALNFTAGYHLNKGYTFGVIGRKRIALKMEISDPALGSDFTFNRYAAHIDWSFSTFFKRRIFPNTLNISLDAGTFSGRLPLQQMGIVDVAPNIVSPFGALRAARFRPYEGEQFLALNVEHDFRTVPFELLGLNYLVRHNIGLIAFAGAARTWTSAQRKRQIFNRTGYVLNSTNGTHLEAGLSINGLFNLFRVDFAKRIDKPVFLVGVSVTRFR